MNALDATVAEASLLTTKMRSLGIEERVTAANVCGTSHIVYVLAGTAKAASISPIVPDLASALAVHRKSVVQMRLRTQPSMALEVNHSAPKPLSWRNCTMGARPGQMTMGRSYDGPTPSDYRTSFARHPHILIVGQTGSGKSNLLVGALLTLAWNSAPEKCRWHMIDLKNEDLQPLAKLPHVASFATGQTAARESVRRFDALLRARTENRPGEHPSAAAPRHILIIDELAHLDDVEDLEEILSMGRSKFLNILAATQTPTQRLIGAKQNYALRMCGAVVDAQTAALATGRRGSGAEALPRPGQFLAVGATTERLTTYHWPAPAVGAMVKAICSRWGELPPEAAQKEEEEQEEEAQPWDAEQDAEDDSAAQQCSTVKWPIRERALEDAEVAEVRRLKRDGWTQNEITTLVYGAKNKDRNRLIKMALEGEDAE